MFEKIFAPIERLLSKASIHYKDGNWLEQKFLDTRLESIVANEFCGRLQSFILSIQNMSHCLKLLMEKTNINNDPEWYKELEWRKEIPSLIARMMTFLNNDFNKLSEDGTSLILKGSVDYRSDSPNATKEVMSEGNNHFDNVNDSRYSPSEREEELASTAVVDTSATCPKSQSSACFTSNVIGSSIEEGELDEDKKLAFIYANAPIGMMNQGNKCYAIAAVRCFLSFIPFIKDMITVYNDAVDKTIASSNNDHTQVSMSEMVMELLPCSTAIIDFGYKSFCIGNERSKGRKNSTTAQRYPSIRYSILEKTLKKLLPTEIMNGDHDQDDAYLLLTNLLDQIRTEMLSVAPEVKVFRDKFLMQIVVSKTCFDCKNVIFGDPGNGSEPIQILSLAKSNELKVIQEKECMKPEDSIHIQDLFRLTMLNYNEVYDLKDWSCPLCCCKRHYRESIVLQGPRLLVLNIKRSKRKRDINEDVDSSVENSFEKDSRSVLIPTVFKLDTSKFEDGFQNDHKRTGNEVVHYHFMNAICHSNSDMSVFRTKKRVTRHENSGHYFVLTKLRDTKNGTINICLSDDKVTELTNKEFKETLSHNATVITYQRLYEGESLDEIYQCNEMFKYPKLSKQVLSHLGNVPFPQKNGRKTRSKTQASIIKSGMKQTNINDYNVTNVIKQGVINDELFLRKKSSTKPSHSGFQRRKRTSRLNLSARKKARTQSSTTIGSINDTKVVEVEVADPLFKFLNPEEIDDNQIIEYEELSLNSPTAGSSSSSDKDMKVLSSQPVLTQMNGVLTLHYKDVISPCIFCGVDTKHKLAAVTYICEECVSSYHIKKSYMMKFYQKKKNKSTSQMTVCTNCEKGIYELVQPSHQLGQFLYCRDCILEGKCKCIVCQSDDCIHQSVRTWNMGFSSFMEKKSIEGDSPVDIFLQKSHLSLMEEDILRKIFQKPLSMIILYFGIYSGNVNDVRSLLRRNSNAPSPTLENSFEGIGAKSIDVILMLYYTRVMTHDSGKLIFTFADKYVVGKTLQDKFRGFINQCFFFYNAKKTGIMNGIFHRDEVFMIMTMDKWGTDWLLLCLKKTSECEYLLYYYCTCSNITETSNRVNDIETCLSQEWFRIYANVSTEMTNKFVLKKINLQLQDPKKKCYLHSPNVLENKSLLAILLLRDWVYDQESSLSETSLNRLMMFFLLSSLFHTPKYIDYSG